jgi:hypothetical protein
MTILCVATLVCSTRQSADCRTKKLKNRVMGSAFGRNATVRRQAGDGPHKPIEHSTVDHSSY